MKKWMFLWSSLSFPMISNLSSGSSAFSKSGLYNLLACEMRFLGGYKLVLVFCVKYNVWVKVPFFALWIFNYFSTICWKNCLALHLLKTNIWPYHCWCGDSLIAHLENNLPVVFWPGEFHGLYSLWGRKESDRTEQLSLTLSVGLFVDSILIMFSMGLSFHQYHTDFCNFIVLKIASIFFTFKAVLAIQVNFHINFRITLSLSTNSFLDFDQDYFKSINHMENSN